MIGENACEWFAWFKSRFCYSKLPSNFNRVGYQIRHTSLLLHARALLESQGKTVSTEGQNRFEIKGKAATLVGKPDLVALGDTNVVCDVKTGRRKASDVVQVMIYMWALQYADPRYRGLTFDGLLVYPDGQLPIPASSLNDEFKEALLSLIGRLGSPIEAQKAPSFAECKYCDISKEHCVERVEEQGGFVATDIF
jgi:hypothetical protein